MYALDTETFLIVPSILAPRMVCLSWAYEDSTGILHRDDPRTVDFVRKLLNYEEITFANAPFDLAVFGSTFPELVPDIFDALYQEQIHDVLIREKLLDIAEGTYRVEEDEEGNRKRIFYSLADIVYRYAKIRMDKDTYRLKYHRLTHLPIEAWPEGALKYATDDAEATLRVHRRQDKSGKAEVLACAPLHVKANMALHLMSTWGIRTDQESVLALEKQAREEYEALRESLRAAGLVSESGSRRTKEAKARILAAYGDEPPKITATGIELMRTRKMTASEVAAQGYVSLDEDACVQSGDPVLLDYARYAKLQNLLQKDVKFLKTGTKIPIQSRFEPLMETGRTSSSSPNIQNIRRGVKGIEIGVRECFVPREGHVLLACDYGAAELHALAQVCVSVFGKSRLADALNAGRDPHLDMGANILQIPYDVAKALKNGADPWYNAQTHDTFTGERVGEARQMAKAANFGFPGGMSPKRFFGYAQAYGLELTPEQCVELRRGWGAQWPEMDEYFPWIRRHERMTWYWMTHPVTGFRRGKMTYTACCNFPFQHLTAHGAKAALWEVTRRQFDVRSSALYGTAIVNFVHDELILEVPEEGLDERARELEHVMCEEYNQTCPDVPVRAEAAAMRYWSKGAKTLHDAAGRMVVWS
jgi:hypothetical protein